jgi:hypothetical protein
VAGLGVLRADPTGVLADGSYLVQLNPARKSDRPPITVRVIEYTVQITTPASGGPEGSFPDWLFDEPAEESSEVFALVTGLLHIQAYPAPDLARPTRCACAPRP